MLNSQKWQVLGGKSDTLGGCAVNDSQDPKKRLKNATYEPQIPGKPILNEDALYHARLDGHVAARYGRRQVDRDNPYSPDGPLKYLWAAWREGFREGRSY